VRQHRCDCYVKAFNSWSHLTAMVFAQLMGVQGLRPLEMGWSCPCIPGHGLSVG
jgi:hypothetical protein